MKKISFPLRYPLEREVQGTTDFHHPIMDALLPQAQPVFNNPTALHTTVDMLDP